MAEIVIVFDFDKTIIEPDSDNWVVDEFGANALFNELLPSMPWNSLMEFHAQGKSLEEIKEVLRRVPIHPRIVPAIKAAYASGCDLRIVSEINTNPSYIDEEEGRLRISPYVDFHTCTHGCPPNMCKGIGDFCPSLKLGEGDFMMPRKDFPVWDLICENREALKSEIHEWTDGKDMEVIMLKLIEKIKIQESSQLVSIEHYKFHESIPKAVHEALPPPLRVHQ
ncbi:inorganic pyrophosphatase 2 [Phtheirospermum japonicum]|uniref:Inorganic pyrophosphatase 2 n=1 Tax=Phtheirospermum japonicum TaxID=374723 RepID=A0A830C3M2_9LAMI|nr:inorganic pyrophosphatase 2 [Phtheirospermum japonicum]